MDAANRLWRPAIRPGLGFGLVLVCAATFAGMRYIGMFGPTSLRWALPLSFTIMALLPWILLGIDGRRRIGLRRANALRWLPAAIAAGALASLRARLPRWLASPSACCCSGTARITGLSASRPTIAAS